MGAAEWSLLVLLSLLWGGSFLFNALAVRELPPVAVVAGRMWLGAPVLLLVVALSGHRMPRAPRVWVGFFVMGALNNLIPFTLIVWGQQHIEVGLAGILNATTPIFTAVLAHVATADERLEAHRVAGILLSVVGMAVLVGPDVLRGLGTHVAAELAQLGAACSYAFGAVYGRRFHGLPPTVAATGMVVGTAVLVAPLSLLAGAPWRPGLAASTWVAVLALGLFSTATAYTIYFRILRTAGATNLMLVTLLVPITALVLGAVVLGERPGAGALGGMALIGAGLVTLDGRLLRRG
jgi:drug/metabolite transporter (DMT)-like permease